MKPFDDAAEQSAITEAWKEKHYSPKELGEIWGMSHDSIIRLIKNERGVFKSCPPHRRGVRKRVTYRIPESVAKRVHERCSN